MEILRLSLAFGENPRARAIFDGRIRAEGIEFVHTRAAMPEIAWRQLHAHEFQVSEMSMSSLIAAYARGDTSFVGLPIFASRSFMQTNVLVRADAGIDEPGQLVGKRIGVPEYQQTAALWARGILHHDFGVDPMSCHWFMERLPEQSHGGTTGFEPPAGLDFHYIPWEQNINEMLLKGDLDATLLGAGSIGGTRRARPTLVNENRSTARLDEASGIRRLFPDSRAEGSRYFKKTGIYPVNHTVVVDRAVLDRDPWAALNIYQAFVEARDAWAGEVRANLQPFLDTGVIGTDVEGEMRTELFPYGVRANRVMLETLADYSFEQGLSTRRVAIEELFYGPTLEL